MLILIDVLTNVIKSLKNYVCKDTIQHALTTIAVEPEADGVRFVATDGHKLAYVFVKKDSLLEYNPSRPFTINNIKILEAEIKLKKQQKCVTLDLTPPDPTKGPGLENENHYSFFPDWKQVIPKGKPKVADYEINPDYLADACKAFSNFEISPRFTQYDTMFLLCGKSDTIEILTVIMGKKPYVCVVG